jgi:hypothetical protein
MVDLEGRGYYYVAQSVRWLVGVGALFFCGGARENSRSGLMLISHITALAVPLYANRGLPIMFASHEVEK